MVVYPRWRGELDRTASVVSSGSGLSPLARGTPVFANLWTIAIRFIPAGAGNTYIRAKNKATATVYPRWRGEHIYQNISFYSHGGLSPLARGTRRDYSKEDAGDRFIPAGAGNTIKKLFCVSFRSVYPRWRGEHFYSVNNRSLIVGLSPLARGTPAVGTVKLRYCRFIPAGAGNTIEIVFGIYSEAVYPRWRGEHKICCKTRCKNSGLSPLARGTPPPVRLTPAQRRFIPAGAGNTRASTSSGIMIPVYPRWRGEHYMISNSWVYSDGLSPLARGTHHQ